MILRTCWPLHHYHDMTSFKAQHKYWQKLRVHWFDLAWTAWHSASRRSQEQLLRPSMESCNSDLHHHAELCCPSRSCSLVKKSNRQACMQCLSYSVDQNMDMKQSCQAAVYGIITMCCLSMHGVHVQVACSHQCWAAAKIIQDATLYPAQL